MILSKQLLGSMVRLTAINAYKSNQPPAQFDTRQKKMETIIDQYKKDTSCESFYSSLFSTNDQEVNTVNWNTGSFYTPKKGKRVEISQSSLDKAPNEPLPPMKKTISRKSGLEVIKKPKFAPPTPQEKEGHVDPSLKKETSDPELSVKVDNTPTNTNTNTNTHNTNNTSTPTKVENKTEDHSEHSTEENHNNDNNNVKTEPEEVHAPQTGLITPPVPIKKMLIKKMVSKKEGSNSNLLAPPIPGVFPNQPPPNPPNEDHKTNPTNNTGNTLNAPPMPSIKIKKAIKVLNIPMKRPPGFDQNPN